MIPLIASSLRAASLARSLSVAKAVTEKAMESVRSLPFYVDYGVQPGKVDVLDLYFPDASSAGYDGTNHLFRTVCASTSTNIECPRAIPSGYTITFEATFVRPATPDAAGQTFEAVTFPPSPPALGYARVNSLTTSDVPPSRILELRVRADWSFAGRARTYNLVGLIGERGFDADRVRGNAVVDYSVQALTGFVRTVPPDVGSKTFLISTIGSAESRVRSRDVNEASQTARGGLLRLTRDDAVIGAGQDLLTGVGATSSEVAPPGLTSPNNATSLEKTIVHPDLAQAVGFLDDTRTDVLKVTTAPEAAGSFTLSAQVISAGDALHSWVTNQAVTGPTSPLRLAPGLPVFSVRPHCDLALCPTSVVVGSTDAEAVPISSAGRKVLATAQIGDAAALPTPKKLEEVHLFPVTYIPGTIKDSSVFKITDFSATVDCEATPSLATAKATASWSAYVWYWDARKTPGALPGTYVPGRVGPIQITSTGNPNALPVDTLQEIQVVSNPRVLDLGANSLFLFDNPQVGQTGYIRRATGLLNPPTEVSDGGRYTAANIDGAIRIDTVPTDSTIPQSTLNISIGKLSCEAVDRR
jgi:hypothetical protein